MTNRKDRLDDINDMIEMLHGAIEGAAGLPPQEDTREYLQGHSVGVELGEDHVDTMVQAMRNLREERNKLLED